MEYNKRLDLGPDFIPWTRFSLPVPFWSAAITGTLISIRHFSKHGHGHGWGGSSGVQWRNRVTKASAYHPLKSMYSAYSLLRLRPRMIRIAAFNSTVSEWTSFINAPSWIYQPVLLFAHRKSKGMRIGSGNDCRLWSDTPKCFRINHCVRRSPALK